MGLSFDEVVAPDMVAMGGPQPNARPIVQPEPAARLVLLRYFQPLTAPDPLHAITANLPTSLDQKCGDPPVAIASILRGKSNDRSSQRILASSDSACVSLRAARLVDDPAGMTFREPVSLADALDRLSAPFGAYKFPEATSFRICFSSERSATSRFRRTFSRSKSFIRLA